MSVEKILLIKINLVRWKRLNLCWLGILCGTFDFPKNLLRWTQHMFRIVVPNEKQKKKLNIIFRLWKDHILNTTSGCSGQTSGSFDTSKLDGCCLNIKIEIKSIDLLNSYILFECKNDENWKIKNTNTYLMVLCRDE